jgi:DNA polymerase elongation subunit (family B)
MKFQLQDAVCRPFQPPIVRREATLAQLQGAGPSADNVSCILLIGRLEDGSSASVCLAQSVGVWVQLPTHFDETLTQRLRGVGGSTRVEFKRVTPVMGYTPHKPGEDLSKPSRRPFARFVFDCARRAKRFFNRRRDYARPGLCKPDKWTTDLRRAQLNIASCLGDDPKAFSVHNLEQADTAFFDDLNRHLGLVDDETVASFGIWMDFDEALVTKLPARMMMTRLCHNYIATLAHVRGVRRADVTPSALSYDLELYSEGGFPKRGDPKAPIFQCGLAFTDDDCATVDTEVLCLRTHTKRLDPVVDPAAATAGAPPTTLRCFDTEQELLEAFGSALRRRCPLYFMGFNIVKFDNQTVWLRALLFHLCHRRTFVDMKRYMDGLPELVRKHNALCDSLKYNHIPFNTFYQRVMLLFGVARGTTGFNARELPEVPRVLSLMEVPFTRAVYDYFSSGPDVAWLFHSGRLPTERLSMQTKNFETNADGQMILDHFGDSFVMLDMWHYAKKNFRLSSNSLKSVCVYALPQDDPANNKIDMPYEELHLSWRSEDAVMLGRVAEYCAQDAALPLQLAFCPKVKAIANVGVFSQVQRASPRVVIMSGQGAKAVCQLLQACSQQGYVPNTPLVRQLMKIKGATVQEPEVGIYPDPVVTIDFASLYPNTNIDFNFSWDTLLEPGQAVPPGIKLFEQFVEQDDPADPDRLERVVQNFMGLLPRLQSTLLKRRAYYKKKMKAATTPEEREFWNKRQLAVKISANGWFGIVAALVGYCAMPRVSALTTKMGRVMIEKVRHHVTTVAKRRVVYGDTDSVLVLYNGCTVPEAFEQSEVLCHHITHQLFGDLPNTAIEVDYVYDGLFVKMKKKYVGVVVTDPTNRDPKKRKLVFKGIDVVRRDTPFYIRDAIQNVFEAMIPIEIGSSKAVAARKGAVVAVLKRELEKLMDHERPLDDFAYNKQMKDASRYANPERIAHVVLAQKMNARIMSGEMTGLPKLSGDRIRYVKVHKPKSSRMCDCAEDPCYMLAHPEKRLQLDDDYLVTRLLSQLKDYLQYHVPGYERYFMVAKRHLGCNTATARRMEAMLGLRPSKNRWSMLKLMVPKKHRGNKKQPLRFKDQRSITDFC